MDEISCAGSGWKTNQNDWRMLLIHCFSAMMPCSRVKMLLNVERLNIRDHFISGFASIGSATVIRVSGVHVIFAGLLIIFAISLIAQLFAVYLGPTCFANEPCHLQVRSGRSHYWKKCHFNAADAYIPNCRYRKPTRPRQTCSHGSIPQFTIGP
jgi:hypothetical protein